MKSKELIHGFIGSSIRFEKRKARIFPRSHGELSRTIAKQ